MQALTKEQKMQMVSDAIDAGFKIQLYKHDSSYEQLDDLLPIFNSLSVEIATGKGVDETTWACINHDREYDDGFAASIFI